MAIAQSKKIISSAKFDSGESDFGSVNFDNISGIVNNDDLNLQDAMDLLMTLAGSTSFVYYGQNPPYGEGEGATNGQYVLWLDTSEKKNEEYIPPEEPEEPEPDSPTVPDNEVDDNESSDEDEEHGGEEEGSGVKEEPKEPEPDEFIIPDEEVENTTGVPPTQDIEIPPEQPVNPPEPDEPIIIGGSSSETGPTNNSSGPSYSDRDLLPPDYEEEE